MNIETGWRFYGADFSLQADGVSRQGRVQLVRDIDSRKLWHLLPDNLQDEVLLFVSGVGTTIEDAMISANMAAAHAAPMPASPEDE